MARGPELIGWTQLYNPKKPISIFFDVCARIAKNSIDLRVLETPAEA
jgi:hypothetical protein